MLRATKFNPDQKPWILTYCHYLWYYVCWWCPRLPAKSQVFPSICGHNNCQSGNSSPCQWGRKPTIIVLTIYIYISHCISIACSFWVYFWWYLPHSSISYRIWTQSSPKLDGLSSFLPWVGLLHTSHMFPMTLATVMLQWHAEHAWKKLEKDPNSVGWSPLCFFLWSVWHLWLSICGSSKVPPITTPWCASEA